MIQCSNNVTILTGNKPDFIYTNEQYAAVTHSREK